MKILVSGSSGLIGTALVSALKELSHDVTRLVRSDTCLIESCIQWAPEIGKIKREQLEGFDAIISLGGVNIASGRWTRRFKAAIVDSRLNSTRLLAETIASLDKKPKTWICASATGYYGHDRKEVVDETSSPGDDFLADLCVKWEAQCQKAIDAGVRVVNLRTGMVLSSKGGALGKILPPFRAGLGGVLGDGHQIMNWISINDTISAIIHLLQSERTFRGVNLVSPNPVTNREFTKTLAKVLHRPAFLPVPAPILKAMLGEMAQSLILSQTSVTPKVLLSSGFNYAYPNLSDCLAHLLP